MTSVNQQAQMQMQMQTQMQQQDSGYTCDYYPLCGCTPNHHPPSLTKDSIVESVMAKFAERSATGLRKYGTTLDRDDLLDHAWANHLQEELMDAILYLERLKKALPAS